MIRILILALMLSYVMEVQSVTGIDFGVTVSDDQENVGSLGLSIAYSPDGNKIAVGTTEGVKIYDDDQSNPVDLPYETDVELLGAVKGVAFSSNNNFLAAVTNSSENGRFLRVWDVAGSTLLATSDNFNNAGPAIEPEDLFWVASTDIYVAFKQQKVMKFPFSGTAIGAVSATLSCNSCTTAVFNCMAVSSTGDIAVGANNDKIYIYIALNNGSDSNQDHELAVLSAPESLIYFTATGLKLAAGSDYKITIFDATDYSLAYIKVLNLDYTLYNFHSLALGMTDKLFAGCLGKVLIFNTADFDEDFQQVDDVHTHYVFGMAIPDSTSSKLATISLDKQFKVFTLT